MALPTAKGIGVAVATLVLLLFLFWGMSALFGGILAWEHGSDWLLPSVAAVIVLAALAVAWRTARRRSAGSASGAARGLLRAMVGALLLIVGALGLLFLVTWVNPTL